MKLHRNVSDSQAMNTKIGVLLVNNFERKFEWKFEQIFQVKVWANISSEGLSRTNENGNEVNWCGWIAWDGLDEGIGWVDELRECRTLLAWHTLWVQMGANASDTSVSVMEYKCWVNTVGMWPSIWRQFLSPLKKSSKVWYVWMIAGSLSCFRSSNGWVDGVRRGCYGINGAVGGKKRGRRYIRARPNIKKWHFPQKNPVFTN